MRKIWKVFQVNKEKRNMFYYSWMYAFNNLAGSFFDVPAQRVFSPLGDAPLVVFETHEIKDYKVTIESKGEHKRDPVGFIEYATRQAGRMLGDQVISDGLYTMEAREGLRMEMIHGPETPMHYVFKFRVIKPTDKHC